MRIWDKNKKSGETEVPADPLGLEGVSAAGGETETAAGTGGRKPSLLQKRGRSRRERKVVRVEEIRRALEDAGEDVDTSLLSKFVRDIIDTLTGNKPIHGSSDSDVPDFYKNNEITWANRRNQ